MKILLYVIVVFCMAISMITAMEKASSTNGSRDDLGEQVCRADELVLECPICFEAIEKGPLQQEDAIEKGLLQQEKEGVSLICCNQLFHQGCLATWRRSCLESQQE